MIPYVNEVDRALCEMNKQYLDLVLSSDYQKSIRISKIRYALRHFDFAAIQMALKHSSINRKIPKYNHKNDVFLTCNNDIDVDKKVAVYTCITGAYDKLIEPLYSYKNIDYYIVTDGEVDPSSKWKKIDINSIDCINKCDNTRKARYIKTHPHVLFPNYEYSVWVDSNFEVIGDLSKFIRCLGKIPFASNWHPDRDCIYTEAVVCKLKGKDDPNIIDKQINNYRKNGFPENFGLVETNMIVRRHMDRTCIKLMEDWWKEMQSWSKRDQLSFPYVVWLNGYTMRDLGFIGTQVRKNTSVRVTLHDSSYHAKYETNNT